MTTGLLNGLRVLDFGQGVAGPYCAQLLGDHGADVIKIEPPHGDWSRGMGMANDDGLTGTFLAVNRNKRGMSLDLRSEESVAVALELARKSDVLVESFRPGVMERLGLGFDNLRTDNASLVYCSVSGFGSSGPNVHKSAGDSTMQAYGGLMSIIGEEDGPPLRVGNVVSDMLGGTNAFAGVLVALLARATDGQGRRVSTSLLDSMIAFQAPPLTEYLLTGVLPARAGNQHPLIAPSGAFATTDGHVTMTVLAHQWDRFCRGLGLDQLVEDPRFATSNARQAHRHELNDLIAPIFSGSTCEDALSRLHELDILCSPINDYSQLVAEEQFRHNRLVRDASDDSGLPMVANPVKVDGDVLSCTAPPALGEHNRQVLSDDLGWDDKRIERFLKKAS